ncbi:hypothetical protein BB559_000401 [Furculomyces boomerangus]|uniref:Uncharacterized protein n=1 Tax=Furculomyces boomerangus TaxID=61424 RepID=A0A2T9Z5C7_9FUNG|nr:hypothetical protein BB559_000401 [Furculomyces boomerangus]
MLFARTLSLFALASVVYSQSSSDDFDDDSVSGLNSEHDGSEAAEGSHTSAGYSDAGSNNAGASSTAPQTNSKKSKSRGRRPGIVYVTRTTYPNAHFVTVTPDPVYVTVTRSKPIPMAT